jgi:hypothetical protein
MDKLALMHDENLKLVFVLVSELVSTSDIVTSLPGQINA